MNTWNESLASAAIPALVNLPGNTRESSLEVRNLLDQDRMKSRKVMFDLSQTQFSPVSASSSLKREVVSTIASSSKRPHYDTSRKKYIIKQYASWWSELAVINRHGLSNMSQEGVAAYAYKQAHHRMALRSKFNHLAVLSRAS